MISGQRKRTTALGVAIAAVAFAWGCAATDAPVVTGRTMGKPVCRVVSGATDEPWLARTPGESWTEGGSHFVVCASAAPGSGDGSPGGHAAESAQADALRQGYAFAFDRLGSRGVRFEDDQIRRMVGDRVAATSRGEETTFPRIRVAGRLIESCARPSAGPDEWRASLLMEYPIAYLRGDVNNAGWHAERAVNEAEVVLSSAEAFFVEGRWFDGLLELERCRDLLDSASAVGRTERVRGEMERLSSWAGGAVSIRPATDVVVVETGERRRIAVGFICSYEWDGRTIPAMGVPMEFRLHGFDAVYAGDPESDAAGVATCHLVSSYGAEGECSIEARVDLGVVAAAAGDDRAETTRAQVREQRVFLVKGAHAVSVCLEIRGLNSVDEAQLRAGFERRARSDGYRVEDCGAGIAAVVTVDALKTSEPLADGWSARVVLEASAFDQRVAGEIGATSILARESTEEGAREADVLALKEAGRLLAAYVSKRILRSRG